jgi:hypothetical protein
VDVRAADADRVQLDADVGPPSPGRRAASDTSLRMS